MGPFYLPDSRMRRTRRVATGFDTGTRCGHDDLMARSAAVGVRELKSKLGSYLQQVRGGRTLVITDRGQPVAELRPISSGDPDEAAMERLIALGLVTRERRGGLSRIRPLVLDNAGLTQAIIEDREDRI